MKRTKMFRAFSAILCAPFVLSNLTIAVALLSRGCVIRPDLLCTIELICILLVLSAIWIEFKW